MPYNPRDGETVKLHRGAERKLVVISGREAAVTIEHKLGPEYKAVAEQIRTGKHTLPGFYDYHKRLEAIFLEEYVKGLEGQSPTQYSKTARNAIEYIISDFKTCLETGQTFERAVRNLGRLTGEGEKLLASLPIEMCNDLRKALLGIDDSVGAQYPAFLTYMWELKQLRPRSYMDTLHKAKWVRLIASAAQAYLAKNPITREQGDSKPIEIKAEDIDPKKASLISVLKDYNRLHPDAPLVEDPTKRLSISGRERLNSSIPLGLDMLIETGMPGSQYLTWIVRYHNNPINIISGIVAIANKYEGAFYGKSEERRLTPEEVFEILKEDLFEPKEIEALDRASRHGYRCDIEELQDNHFFVPFQMMRLLFGILEGRH
jgi:hypothetical protein